MSFKMLHRVVSAIEIYFSLFQRLKPNNEGSAGLISPEASFLALHLAALLLVLHVIVPWSSHSPVVSLYLQNSSSYKDISQIGLRCPFTLITFFKAQSPSTVTFSGTNV